MVYDKAYDKAAIFFAISSASAVFASDFTRSVFDSSKAAFKAALYCFSSFSFGVFLPKIDNNPMFIV